MTLIIGGVTLEGLLVRFQRGDMGGALERLVWGLRGTSATPPMKMTNPPMKRVSGWWFGEHQFYFPIYWEFHHPN